MVRASAPAQWSEPKSPGKEGCGVSPNAGLGIAENDDDDVTTRARAAGIEAVPGGFGIARFHSVAVRQTLQHYVRVFQLAGPADGVPEDELRKTDYRTDRRISIGGSGDSSEIHGGGK